MRDMNATSPTFSIKPHLLISPSRNYPEPCRCQDASLMSVSMASQVSKHCNTSSHHPYSLPDELHLLQLVGLCSSFLATFARGQWRTSGVCVRARREREETPSSHFIIWTHPSIASSRGSSYREETSAVVSRAWSMINRAIFQFNNNRGTPSQRSSFCE